MVNLMGILAAVAGLILLTSRWRMHAFPVLFLGALLLAMLVKPLPEVLPLVREGFSRTLGAIGFLVIAGSFIAVVLERTGSAVQWARWLLYRLGARRAPLALGLSGYLSGLLLFCDTGFILLSSLVKSLGGQGGLSRPFLAGILAISLYTGHCLTPTHPGMLGALALIPADFGLVLFFGALAGLPGLLAASFWLRRVEKFGDVDELQTLTGEKEPTGQASIPALIPVFLPLLFLIGGSWLTLIGHTPNSGTLAYSFQFVAQPPVALTLGAISAAFLLRPQSITPLNEVIAQALERSGPVLLITAAGGAFGGVIKEGLTGLPLLQWLGNSPLGLWIPFLLAVFLKIAQGSSTIAVLTSAALMQPLLGPLGLDSPSDSLACVLALGAGSMVFSHANDSYFWVITQFSEITPQQTARRFSIASAWCGVVSMGIIQTGYALLG